MERAKRKRYPLWLRIALGLMIAAALLVVAAVALRFWITSDGGRAFIVSQIDGRKIGPLGTLRVSGLKGDPLGSATLADIALIDDDGVWLRAKDARIEWTPTDLFAGNLEIQAIGVHTVDVLRQPRLALQDDNAPGPDIGLRLEAITVDDLHLAEPVIGIEARYGINGGLARPRDGRGFAKLTLSPVSGPADAANIAAEWTPEGSLKASAEMSGPPGGLIATMLQSPEDKPVAFKGDVDGTLQAFTSSGALRFGDAEIATFTLSRSGDTAQLDARIDPTDWPILAEARRAGGPITLKGSADLRELSQAPVTLSLSAPAGALEASAELDLVDFSLPGPITTHGAGLDLASLSPPLAGTANAEGILSVMVTGVSWKGTAEAAQFAFPSGAAAHVTAPVELDFSRNTLSWQASNVRLDGARISSLPALAQAAYTAAGHGDVNLRTGLVEIYASQVEGAPGAASARGTIDSKSGAISLEGSARIARLSDVAPLTGAGQGRWTLRATSASAPIRIGADFEGRGVGSHITTLAELAGTTPRVVLNGVVSNGRFAVESGSVRGAGVTANLKGAITDAGVIRGEASGALTRRIEVGGAIVGATAFTADLRGDITKPLVNLHIKDGSVSAAGVAIRDLSGDAEARFGEAITGRFTLAGASDVGPFKASGELQAGEGDWRVNNLKANLGELKFAATRLAAAGGDILATFTAMGPLAGIAGLDRGQLNATGDVRIGDTLRADVSGRITDVRSAGMRLDLLSFTAKANGGAATVEAHARGSVGAPLDLTVTAKGAQDGRGWAGDASVTGTIDNLPISTSRPAVWRQGPDGWSLDAAIRAFRGDIDLALVSDSGAANAKVALQNVNLRGVTRVMRLTPMQGDISGNANFANGAGPASGQFNLTIANANPVGVTADPLTLNVKGTLANGILISNATGSGQGFKLDASSRLPVLDGEGFSFALDPQRPMESATDLDGRAEQLWGLFGPEGQTLRGHLTANVRARGTLSQPILEGGMEVAEGAYEHGETGLSLRDISVRGAFDQNSARITGLRAIDGKGGTLTGQGDITWNGALKGGVTFHADELRVLGRDDRLAVVSGDGAVKIGAEDIEVSGKLAVSQARISIEQPASSSIPTIPGLRRVNFPNQEDEEEAMGPAPPWQRPMQLDIQVAAPRRIVVFGRGLDTEWGANLHVTGPIADPSISGTATLVRGSLDLAGKRFAFDTGTITLDGPIRTARIDISADRTTADITASVHVTGTPVEPKFVLESSPALPQDQVLARVLFGRSVTELSGFEAAQLAAGLAQLAGGQAGFNPVGLVRQATGLDRVSVGAEGGIATVAAGKYIADDVYVQVGAGGTGGVGAEVEWEPTDGLSIISSADGNGDTKIAVRWKKDY